MKITLVVSLVCSLIGLAAVGWAQEEEPQSATLANPGFESPAVANGAGAGTAPEGWFGFCSMDPNPSGLTDRKKRNGVQAYAFRSVAAKDGFNGLACKFPVKPGDSYEFSVYAINDPRDPVIGNSFGQISLEWQDEEGKEITRTWGPTWNFELSPIRWEKVAMTAAAPNEEQQGRDAVFGVAVVTFYCKDSAGKGTFYVDDCELAVAPPPAE